MGGGASRHRPGRARPYPPVPRYPADFAVQQSAARVLRAALDEQPPSLRESRCFRTVSSAQRSAVFACVCETTRRIGVLRRALRAVPGLGAHLRDDLAEDEAKRGEDGGGGRGGRGGRGELAIAPSGEVWVERASGPRVVLTTSLACVMLHDLLVASRWLGVGVGARGSGMGMGRVRVRVWIRVRVRVRFRRALTLT